MNRRFGIPQQIFLCLLVMAGQAPCARAADDQSDEDFAVHGQVVFIDQYHPAFRSPYRGANSLDPGSRGDETVTATLSVGLKLWDGGQFYVDPEVDQGFGLSDTLGLAGFSNGEGSKVGSATPYFRLQQVFFRQAIDLGGETHQTDSAANQLGMSQTDDNIIITLGKFPIPSVFDTNAYAHDASSDFLNWSLIDSASYDYAADAWGYTYGGSAEWTQSWWTLRSGFFALSRVPNGRDLQTDFTQFQGVGEVEARYDLFGRQGRVKFLAYVNRARMGSYNDALRLAEATHSIPDTGLVRRYASRPGFALNVEQPVTDNLGAFLRASFNNGDEETYEFTDINRSTAAGISLKGSAWGRKDDTVGVAGVVNAISDSARRYFGAGGLGVLIGDGRLPHYAAEDIMEVYYSARATSWFTASVDYQFVANPAYNADRGPVSILGIRLKAGF